MSALQAGPDEESPTLKALQQALDASLLTPEGMGIKNPHLKKKTQVLALDFVRPGQNDLELELGQLSDGFRTLFALVTDLLRRIVESNPAFEGEADPATRWRNTRAVVLIDEIDAHLHPSWQKTVLSGLLAAFPHAQFFVTTHSPGAGAERDATVWELEDGKVSKVGQLYGKTPDALLQDYLETELRPRALAEQAGRSQRPAGPRRIGASRSPHRINRGRRAAGGGATGAGQAAHSTETDAGSRCPLGRREAARVGTTMRRVQRAGAPIA